MISRICIAASFVSRTPGMGNGKETPARVRTLRSHALLKPHCDGAFAGSYNTYTDEKFSTET